MAIHIITRLLIFILVIPLSTTVIGNVILFESNQSLSQHQYRKCGNGDIYAFFMGFIIGILLYLIFLLTDAYLLNKKGINNKRNFNLITAIVLFLLIGIPIIFDLN
ncbi:MAG TPA: hypothetical protein VF677_14930 [Flavobacterium sp.]|jgi:hypothetical protein